MGVRRAAQGDYADIMSFLSSQTENSMFPLSNLAAHGIVVDDDAEASHIASSVWIIERADRIVGVVCVTRSGMVMPVFDGRIDEDWQYHLRGRNISGFMGNANAVRPVMARLDLSAAEIAVDEDEPQYALMLDALIMPDITGFSVVPCGGGHQPTASEWRGDYHIEALGTKPEDARARGETDVASYVSRDSHRILMKDNIPVAMTGITVEANNTVSIGGVYTPPATRRRGLARRAVALHMAELSERGITKAVLSAANTAAARAYEAIGFTHIGTYSLVLFHNSVEVKA